MKEFLKSLIVPVATYGILRGGEAIISGVRSYRKKKKEQSSSEKSESAES